MQGVVEDRVLELVTKTEFQEGLRALEIKILELKAHIEAGRVDTLKWMSTLLMGGITIVLGAMYFMFTVFLKH